MKTPILCAFLLIFILSSCIAEPGNQRVVESKVGFVVQDTTHVFLPEYFFEKPDGSLFNFSEVKGKVLLFDFWSTSCGPCIRQHPEVEALVEKINHPDLKLINISIDHNKETWTRFCEKENWSGYQIHLDFDPDNPLFKMVRKPIQRKNGDTVYQAVIPKYFLVDKDLNIEEIKDLHQEGIAEKIKSILD